MKKLTVYFLAVFFSLNSFMAMSLFAFKASNSLSEIHILNALPGSKELLINSGGGCIRWEQRCKPNAWFPEREDCTSECSEYSNDSSSSSSSSGSNSGGYSGPVSPFFMPVALGLVGAACGTFDDPPYGPDTWWIFGLTGVGVGIVLDWLFGAFD